MLVFFIRFRYLFLFFKWLFRSLKLGVVPGPITSPGSCQPLVYTIRNSVDVSNFSWNDKKTRQGKESSILSRSCLNPISGDNGAAGYMPKLWHIVNLMCLVDGLMFITCFSIGSGLFWEGYTFTTLKEWIMHHFVLHYQPAHIFLIWRLWACKFLCPSFHLCSFWFILGFRTKLVSSDEW